MEKLIKDAGLPKKIFAQKIGIPPQTLSGWFKHDDIPLSQIRKCCAVLKIKLWEFFVEDDTELKDYVPLYLKKQPEWIEFLKTFDQLTEEKKKLLLRAFIDILTVSSK